VEQEPRAVAEGVAPPQRGPRALPEVEEFLVRQRVRCQRFSLQRTFRSILYGQQQKRKQAAAPAAQKGGDENMVDAGAVDATKPATDDAVRPDDEIAKDAAKTLGSAADTKPAPGCKSAASKEPAPWEQYMKVNSKFVKQGQFVQTVSWDAGGRRVLAVVPHPLFVDKERLAKAVQVPAKTVRMRKLKDMASETGWPLFVCTPFGHPKDAQGREPVLLMDSTLTEVKKPLLFDCGTVGLSVPVSEFLRSTHAACVEGLAQAKQQTGTSKAHAAEAAAAQDVDVDAMGGGATALPTMVGSPEPAPEPAPVASPSSGEALPDSRSLSGGVDLPMAPAEAPQLPALAPSPPAIAAAGAGEAAMQV